MNEHAKKLWDRVCRKRQELGAADFAVCQAEAHRAGMRQAVGELMVRFNEHVTELAVEEGLDPNTARFSLDAFEFEPEPPAGLSLAHGATLRAPTDGPGPS